MGLDLPVLMAHWANRDGCTHLYAWVPWWKADEVAGQFMANDFTWATDRCVIVRVKKSHKK